MSTKTVILRLRVTPQDCALIQRGAAVERKSLSAFIRDLAVLRAARLAV